MDAGYTKKKKKKKTTKKKKKKKKKTDHNDVLEKPGKITKFVKTALETAKNRITKTRKPKEQTLAEKH